MKAVIQRVSSARVEVDASTVGAIARGFLVLLGVQTGDTDEDARYLARKVAGLRIFEDDGGKMNLSLGQVRGECLVVSQFTLCADTTRGNRPGFDGAAPAAEAERLYKVFTAALSAESIPTKTGVFGAHMKVSLVNDGPVTINIDSAGKPGPR